MNRTGSLKVGHICIFRKPIDLQQSSNLNRQAYVWWEKFWPKSESRFDTS